MKYFIQCESLAGEVHRSLYVPNQDAMYYIHDDHAFSAVLADGAGSQKRAGEGAKIAAVAVSNYLFSNYKMLLEASHLYIQNEIMSVVQSALKEKSMENGSEYISDMGSTLLLVVTDGDRYLAGHLGDGVIMGSYGDRLTVISFPENGKSKNSTYLTTSFDAQKHLRIRSGDLSDFDSFLLLTDGIIPNLFDGGYLLKHPMEIDAALARAIFSEHDDDASCLKISWRAENG